MTEEEQQFHIEVDCPGRTAFNATVKINGKMVPIIGLTLEWRVDRLNRAILEVEPTEVDVVTDALAGIRVVKDGEAGAEEVVTRTEHHFHIHGGSKAWGSKQELADELRRQCLAVAPPDPSTASPTVA